MPARHTLVFSATSLFSACEPAVDASLALGGAPCEDGAVVDRGALATPELLFFVQRTDGPLAAADVDVTVGAGSDDVCLLLPAQEGDDGALRVGVRFSGRGACLVDVAPAVPDLTGRCTVRGTF